MKSAEQQARDTLERLDVKEAQNMSTGDITEIANLIREVQRLKILLQNTREYVSKVSSEAEKRHDDSGELYDYEEMNKSKELLKAIDIKLIGLVYT